MKLSFVILNYKNKNLTRECIKGILNINLPFEHEVIVVDNGSHDGVCDLVNERFSQKVKCIQLNKNIGMGAGNNHGLKLAQGELIMVLNPDTVLEEQSILPLVKLLDQNPKAGIVAPRLVNPDKSHQASVYKFPSFLMPFYRRTFLGATNQGRRYLANYIFDPAALRKNQKVDWVLGAAFMIRKSLADQLHGFDPRFFLFFEDTDLCRRVWAAGYEVWYVPSAQLVHYPHRASGHDLGLWSLRKKATWHHIASWLKYFWKWRNK